MSDYILRLTIENSAVAFIALTTETVNEAARIHRSSPVVTAAMGRLITAAAMMGAQLKNDSDLLTLSIKSDGPVGGIVATADKNSNVKAYPFVSDVDLPLNSNGKLDVAACVGKGNLNVVMDLGLKEPYVGTVKLVSGEIGDDLAYYFAVSEQIPSAVCLGVLVDRDYSVAQAGGFLMQMLPGASDELITRIEEKLSGFDAITSFYESGKTPYDLAEYFFEGLNYTVTEKTDVNFFCNCSREKVEKALISLGREELAKILNEDGKATLHCHFCRKDYSFDEGDLKRILES
ncbi:MAG: Hsp33 family molecular chaperone HslO [Clostridiales bacterium]|nr:Hsp33 family molecular chaperone HslO [Clostridiales bacterium]